jgi:hypothetical protein
MRLNDDDGHSQLVRGWMQGANLLYMKFILPTLKQHEVVIDRYVELGESNIQKSLAQLVCPKHSLPGPECSRHYMTCILEIFFQPSAHRTQFFRI